MFSNLSLREKIIIYIAVIVILITGYYYYIYKPYQQKFTELEQKIEQKNNRIEVAKEYARKLPQLKERYENIKSRYADRGVYEEKNVIDLLIDFREVSRSNNVEMSRFRPVVEEGGISISVNLKAGYKELIDLFYDFKEWNYWFEFKQLKINGTKENLVSISMNVFYHDKQEPQTEQEQKEGEQT